MDLAALYAVLTGDNMNIQVWVNNPEFDPDDSIIFEGRLYAAYDSIEAYMDCRVFQIEVNNLGMIYIGIESPNSY